MLLFNDVIVIIEYVIITDKKDLINKFKCNIIVTS